MTARADDRTPRRRPLVSDRSNHLDLLAVTLVDIRATIEDQHRAIRNAQASLDKFQYTQDRDVLRDITSCIGVIRDHAATLATATSWADEAIQRLQGERPSDPPND